MQEVTISSLGKFLDWVESDKFADFVFRGQSQASWGLVPSIFRGIDISSVDDFIEDLERIERDITREFEMWARRYDANIEGAWDTLVAAQHYGTPTRLLDWTSNALAAAYFATASSPNTDGVVWRAQPSNVPIPPEMGRIHLGRGLRVEQIRRFVKDADLPFRLPVSTIVAAFPPEVGLTTDPEVGLSTESKTQEVGASFEQSHGNTSGILVFLTPPFSNARIAAQNGLFSVYVSPRDCEVVADHCEYLRSVEDKFGCSIIDRAIIPADIKREILRGVGKLGVNAVALFPDLNGLSTHLQGVHRELIDSLQE